MGWKAKTGTEVLASVVATLLSLADLAEHAAGRSYIVRWLALWYVWQADAIVREFVAGSEWNTAGRHWSPALPAVRYGTDPADAMALAVSLRSLTLTVRTMAAQRRRLSFLHFGQASAEAGNGGKPPGGNRQAGHEIHQILRNTHVFALSRMERIDSS